MTDTEIIPVALAKIDGHEIAINALIEQKRALGLAELTNGANTDEILRRYYLEAAEAGLILKINLAIRLLGAEGPPGVWGWRALNHAGVQIVAIHNGNTGITDIRVGQILVLSNELPGAERLQPGEWLKQLHGELIRRQNEEMWRESIANNREKANKIADFMSDV